ncbi:MAG: hypothetical protein ABSG53_19205, partial [Thermoguttaceae bacterium]
MSTATLIRPEPASGPIGSPFIAAAQLPDPFTLVIFGANGDLSARKLMPAIYGLWHRRFLPQRFAVVGLGRTAKTDESFRQDVRSDVVKFRHVPPAENDWNDFLGSVFYHQADVTTSDGIQSLARRLQGVESQQGLPGNRLAYLATDPQYFCRIIEGLAGAGMINREVERPWGRVVIEKPFGFDLQSAVQLDRNILRFLRPDQIYRIDHYLGKDTVQNLLAFRFGNAIFEPLFNREHVEHVQITVAETVGMEGRRGAFY